MARHILFKTLNAKKAAIGCTTIGYVCIVYYIIFVLSFFFFWSLFPEADIEMLFFPCIVPASIFVVLIFRKQPLKAVIIFTVLGILAPLVLIMIFPGDKVSKGAAAYEKCVYKIETLKDAQEKYYSEHGAYAKRSDDLARDLIPECGKGKNSRCKGKVKELILKDCADYRIITDGKTSFEITGVAKDEFRCFVCPTPSDDYSSFGKWECPTRTKKDCK